MKINGSVLTLYSQTDITLRRGKELVALTVSGKSADFNTKFVEEIGLLKYPKPIKVPVKAEEGSSRPKRDEKDKIIMETKFTPEQEKEIARVNQHHMALRVKDALRDSTAEFDSVAPTGTDKAEWQTYCDALHTEIRTGFTEEEALRIIEISDALADQIDMDKDIADFLYRQKAQ